MYAIVKRHSLIQNTVIKHLIIILFVASKSVTKLWSWLDEESIVFSNKTDQFKVKLSQRILTILYLKQGTG